MKILLTGCSGQLGEQIIKQAPKNFDLVCLNRNKLDLSNFEACYNAVIDKKPDWIINAGAYTDVDQADIDKDSALAINAGAPKAFSKALKVIGGKILQISTDYVFDGKQKSPYRTNDGKSPINFYGYTKSLAEEHIKKILGGDKNFLILRSSWLVGPSGKNFLLKMLSLQKKKSNIKVVSDQIGSMTSTISLAKACWQSIAKYTDDIFHKNNNPILHFTEIGEASWYEIALEIGEVAFKNGFIDEIPNIKPINSYAFKTIAKRPNYSVLDCTESYKILNFNPPHWKNSLRDIIKYSIKFR